MPAQFTMTQLRQLLKATFRLEGDDAELLRATLRTCLAEGVNIKDILGQIFEEDGSVNAYPLKKLFRALSGFNQFDALAQLVEHSSPEVRLGVIHAWYNYGLASDAPRIEKLLNDENPQVRARAREAIDVISNPLNQPRAREAIDGALTDQEQLVARVILGQLGPSDVGPVARLLDASSGVVRQLAREALRRTDTCGNVVIDVIGQIDASGRALSEEAVGALQDVADERAIGLLIQALRQNKRTTHAADALVALGLKAGPQLLDAFQYDPDIRRRWGRLVARVAGPSALDALLAALGSRYSRVRESAAAGLQELRQLALPALVERLPRAEADESAVILGILGSSRSPEALEPILARTADTNSLIRIATIRALAEFDTAEATRVLLSAAASPNWQIRRAAAETLGHRNWTDYEAVRILSELLGDPNPKVSAAAATSLDSVARSFSLDAVESLVRDLTSADRAERERAHGTLEALVGVIAFSIAAPRISSPEGEIHRGRIEKDLRAHFDLTVYDAAARRRLTSQRPPLALPVAEPRSTHPAISDAVRFSVLSPMTVPPGEPCLIDVWVHSGDIDDVLLDMRTDPAWQAGVRVRSKGPVEVDRGANLISRVMVPSLGWADEDTVKWTGAAGNATYSFIVPADAAHSDHAGQLQIHVGGIQLARVAFLITVGSDRAVVHDVTVSQRLVSSAFASYATEDRNEVLARIQGMQQVARHLDVFLDVVSLRSGDRWEERLESEILERDILYLFWSRAASASLWVDKEWRTVYRARGLDGIEPVPLEPPDVSPPPHELRSLHFNDWTLQIRRRPDP